MVIEVMSFPYIIYNIQEYVGHIQEEKERTQVLCILKVYHIVMLKGHHRSYPVFTIR